MTYMEKQLKTKIHIYESEVKEEYSQSHHISQQIRTVERELSKVRLDSDFENATKAKKLIEYEKINDLLNHKMELLAQENIEMIEKNMTLSDKLAAKEDQFYDLAQELVAAKEHAVQMEAELEAIREEGLYLEERKQFTCGTPSSTARSCWKS
jgi:hypothetical protein